MEFQYNIRETDYVNSNILSAIASKKQLIWLFAGGFGLLLLGVFGQGAIKGMGFGGLVCGILGYFITLYVYTPWQAKRQYKNYKLIQAPLKIELVDDGFKISAEHGQTHVKWESLVKWRENDNYILIYFAPKLYYLIPKRIDKSGFNVNRLRQSLKEKIGKPI
ncbi:hypothetical protein D3OALGB2SA_643 [Olavius algarvensis associated proteobacterium Delta 3]|nr:hypothetical protein D3OALGB2SA_643 [Olavius algarvensis associated proteobacterium Delta 3]